MGTTGILGVIGVIEGIYRDDEKENGICYIIGSFSSGSCKLIIEIYRLVSTGTLPSG